MTIDEMKKAACLNGRAHYETGSALIRCEKVERGFDWRKQVKTYDPHGGRLISEAEASRALNA